MNNFITTDWVSMRALRLLLNKLAVSLYFNDDYNSEYQRPFSPGETIRIQYPPLFAIRNGVGYDPQAIQQIYTTITVDQIFGIDFQWDDVEAALKLERDDKRTNDFYMKSPMKKIAQEWDLRSATFAHVYTPNMVGVLGTAPTNFVTFLTAAEQILFEQAGLSDQTDDGEYASIISSGMNTGLISGMVTQFNPQADISKQQRRSQLGMLAGGDVIRSMSLRRHTNGSIAGAFTVSGADQSGSSLTVNMTAGDTVTRGTKIGIANVYPTNPETNETVTTARTMIVSVTQDVTAAGGGADVLPITPPIYGPLSVFQNVSALPANGATLTVTPGTVSPNTKTGIVGVALQRDAFFRVSVPLQLPTAVEIAKQHRDAETGFSIRFTRTWDAIQMRNINRFDTMGGYGVGYNFNCSVELLGA